MPVPIIPQNVDSLTRKEREMQTITVDYGKLDISDLANLIQKRSLTQEIIKVSDFEAGLLFRLWKDSKCNSSDETMSVPNGFSNCDILRLKSSGLISGDTEKVRFTTRGKEVITTMVLSEGNAFDKKSSSKKYEQRVSETKLRGTPRLAVGKK